MTEPHWAVQVQLPEGGWRFADTRPGTDKETAKERARHLKRAWPERTVRVVQVTVEEVWRP